MQEIPDLSQEETLVTQRLQDYFKSPQMSFHDKIFHAILIAQHELDTHNFVSENEKSIITEFKLILENLEKKYLYATQHNC